MPKEIAIKNLIFVDCEGHGPVRDAIFHEEDNDDMQKVIAIFDRGGDVSELSTILELVSDAWNYFPHKVINGLSPAEKLFEYQNKQDKKK